MSHKKHRGDFKDEEDDEEESEETEEQDFDEEDEEQEEEQPKIVKKEISKPKQVAKTNQPSPAIKLELVQAVKEYEPAIQFPDGSYVKLNDTEFKIWVIRKLMDIEAAIG